MINEINTDKSLDLWRYPFSYLIMKILNRNFPKDFTVITICELNNGGDSVKSGNIC